jgi:predicted RNA-binding Zn ribbon-like protein
MNFLFIDFLNSEWRDGIRADSLEDRLDKPGWLENMLAEWGITVEGPPKEEELKALKELRSWLHGIVRRMVKGNSPDGEDLKRLNAYLERVPVHRRLVQTKEGYRLEFSPIRRDWNRVMAEIVRSFADLLISADPRRLRICENERCLWIFYDESRNRSRRWCDHRTCGNLMNVRKFRERQRNHSGKK